MITDFDRSATDEAKYITCTRLIMSKPFSSCHFEVNLVTAGLNDLPPHRLRVRHNVIITTTNLFSKLIDPCFLSSSRLTSGTRNIAFIFELYLISLINHSVLGNSRCLRRHFLTRFCACAVVQTFLFPLGTHTDWGRRPIRWRVASFWE